MSLYRARPLELVLHAEQVSSVLSIVYLVIPYEGWCSMPCELLLASHDFVAVVWWS